MVTRAGVYQNEQIVAELAKNGGNLRQKLS
jgi:hypothetical protein